MTALIILLACMTVVAMVAGLIHQRKIDKKIESGELEKEPEIKIKKQSCGSCDPYEACNLSCVLQKANTKVEYYDDEELDRYKGRPADSYTDEEIEEFAEVLYSCLPEEVPGWSRSLELRGIKCPDQLKPELIMLIQEQVEAAAS